MNINAARLISRLEAFGELGRDAQSRLARLAFTDADKAGRDQFVSWCEAAGLSVNVDQIGNIHAIWQPESVTQDEPVMMGSHIDTVRNAGIYDGNYGVLAGLEVIMTLQEHGFAPVRPLVVTAFSNEEGARYAPDMMGSLVYAGGLDVATALNTRGVDDSRLGEELARIGYAGEAAPGFLQPKAYLELHIEQGPVLERSGIPVGAVADLQGISWQSVTIQGTANHAGTTPLEMRADAGLAAARVITFVREYAAREGNGMVATVGTIGFEPDIINVIPSSATFTVDLRSPDEAALSWAEHALAEYLQQLQADEGVTVTAEQLVRFQPVIFDEHLVTVIEQAAEQRDLACRRMTSGAGHDAQMMARICPAAMIFVPSKDGISHNPREFTPADDLIAGANILLDAVIRTAG